MFDALRLSLHVRIEVGDVSLAQTDQTSSRDPTSELCARVDVLPPPHHQAVAHLGQTLTTGILTVFERLTQVVSNEVRALEEKIDL